MTITISIYTLSAICIILLIVVYIQYRTIKKAKLNVTKLKNISAFKEQTANMIVHDLKVPLSTLINVELIKDGSTRLKMVKQASQRMMLLVQNVLDIYKYETTKIKLKKESVDLHNLIESTLVDFELMLDIKKLKINLNKHNDILVLADKTILERVVSNILSNSIKFSPKNSSIDIYLKADKNKVTVRFFNNGPGIPKSKQATIFNSFEQAQIRNFGRLPSTGLGLTFCNIAIEAHKGKIGVISDSKEGAEFWFSLPIG